MTFCFKQIVYHYVLSGGLRNILKNVLDRSFLATVGVGQHPQSEIDACCKSHSSKLLKPDQLITYVCSMYCALHIL